MNTVEELSQAFAPCTIAGLAEKLWEAYGARYEAQQTIDALTQVLGDHCRSTGEVVSVEGQPDLRWTEVGIDFDAYTHKELRPRFALRFDKPLAVRDGEFGSRRPGRPKKHKEQP